jgi:8-oxo-dGTP pyrophosphatase MutT (NUDIX family)
MSQGRLAVIHRHRYDDWSLPKGKLEPGETVEAAALREVEEETGLRCRLGARLGATRYRDRHGRPKVVDYFAMTVAGGEFRPNDEVDEMRWVTPAEAIELVSHEGDRTLLRALEQTA